MDERLKDAILAHFEVTDEAGEGVFPVRGIRYVTVQFRPRGAAGDGSFTMTFQTDGNTYKLVDFLAE